MRDRGPLRPVKVRLEAFFDENDIEYDANDTIVSREISTSGKSRAFINDTPVALSMLKELGEQLVDIHSQHQNLLLNKQDFQLNVVDILAKDSDLLKEYQENYSLLSIANRQLEELKESIERNRQQVDFLQFQCEELEQANLVLGEQEELEQQSETMSHAEEIKSALYDADNQLSSDQQGALDAIRQTLHSLNSISRVLPAASELTERLESCHIELKDIADEVKSSLRAHRFRPFRVRAYQQSLGSSLRFGEEISRRECRRADSPTR